MKKNVYFFLLLLFLSGFINLAFGQQWRALVKEDFGYQTVANLRSQTPATELLPGTTNYNPLIDNINFNFNDGNYMVGSGSMAPRNSVTQSASFISGVMDHTPDSENPPGTFGNLFAINANPAKRGEAGGSYYLYKTSAFDVPGASYRISFWGANLLKYTASASTQKPGHVGLAVRDQAGNLYGGQVYAWTLQRTNDSSNNSLPWTKNEISFNLPPDYIGTELHFNFFNSDPDPDLANTNGNDLTLDDILIEMLVVTFRGKIFIDTNSNGIQDGAETPYNGITNPLYVYVVNKNGKVVSRAQVAADGTYFLDTTNGLPFSSIDIGLKVIVASSNLNYGDVLTASSINNYTTVSENPNGSTFVSMGATDGTANVVKSDADIANINFGIKINCSAPAITTTPATCSAAGTASLTNFVATQTYAFLPAGPTIGAAGVISNFVPGVTYTLTTSGTCAVPMSSNFTVPSQLVTPAAPVLAVVSQPSAGQPNGTFQVNGYNTSQYNYAISPSVGTSISGTGLVTAPAGNYTVTATSIVGGCTSPSSNSIAIVGLPPGFIYVHKKAVSEIGSSDFNFTISPNGQLGTNSFALNDTPDGYNAFDLGGSYGDGAGQIWAVASTGSFTANTHGFSGGIFTRKAGSSIWSQIPGITTARSIDGVGKDTAVYTDALGNVFKINANGTTTQIYAGSAGNIAVDVASGGPSGVIVAVIGASTNPTSTVPIAMQNRKLYKYVGPGTSLADWQEFTNAGNQVFRVDVHSETQDVFYVNFWTETNGGDQNVHVVPSANPAAAVVTTINAPANTDYILGQPGASYNNRRDIAVTQDRTLFSSFSIVGAPSTAPDLMEMKNGGIWVYNDQSRNLAGPTGGPGNQVWAINKGNAGISEHTIYTRTNNGSWLDDERIRIAGAPTATATATGNSIMIPVAPGTYTLTENAVSSWKLSEIAIDNPNAAANTSNLTGRTATLTVAAGEIAHVTFQNTLINQIVAPNDCKPNILMTFGSGTNNYGPPLVGLTAYHYKYPTINGGTDATAIGSTGDGYYSLIKNNDTFFSSAATGRLTNHTPNDPDGYFAAFNASYAKDDFFRQTITGLTVGAQYQLSFWAANLTPNNTLKPNAIMGITDANGNVSGSVSTGDITGTDWKVYTFNFTATSTTGEIYLKNNGIGGSGNDIAIDDVAINMAPPTISPIVGTTEICIQNGLSSTSQFNNATAGGTWSSDNSSLVSIDANSGLATTNTTGALGLVNITYTYVDPITGCVSYEFFQVTLKANCACFNPANTSVAGIDTKHGITLLKRAGSDNGNWPMNRKSAHTVLESNTKGFVVTRVSNPQSAISNPVEGMMVYDTTAKCLKIYADGAWSCFSTPACP